MLAALPSIPDFALLLIPTLAAGIVRGFTGFGAALVMAPAFALLRDPKEAVALVILLNTFTIVQLLPSALPRTNWRVVVPMSAAACVTIPFGILLLLHVDPVLLRHGIAVAVLAFALLLLLGVHYAGPSRVAASVGVGAASGILTGIGGIGGPPAVLYLLSGGDSAARYRGSLITYFAIIQTVTIVPLLVSGVLTLHILAESLALVPCYMVATYLGARLFRRASDQLYRNLAIGLLMAIAITALAA